MFLGFVMNVEKPDPILSNEQKVFFDYNGFVVIKNLLPESDLKPLEDEYSLALEKLAIKLKNTNKINHLYKELEFKMRYIALVSEYPELHRFLNISLPLTNDKIDPELFVMHSGPAVFNILRHPRILDLVEEVIGSEISCSPVQQMRMKPPEKSVDASIAGHSNVGSTTWHQDIVALLPEADNTQQVTVWLAITDSNMENGCLTSIPRSHTQGPKVHCSNLSIASEPQVPNSAVQDSNSIPLPVKKGGAILFHKMNIHRSLPNNSKNLRWSMDLRYHPIGQNSGRPAFPGFVARSKLKPETELHDPAIWKKLWENSREKILEGRFKGKLFEDTRWHDNSVC